MLCMIYKNVHTLKNVLIVHLGWKKSCIDLKTQRVIKFLLYRLNKSESTPLSINDRSIRIMKGAI